MVDIFNKKKIKLLIDVIVHQRELIIRQGELIELLKERVRKRRR